MVLSGRGQRGASDWIHSVRGEETGRHSYRIVQLQHGGGIWRSNAAGKEERYPYGEEMRERLTAAAAGSTGPGFT